MIVRRRVPHITGWGGRARHVHSGDVRSGHVRSSHIHGCHRRIRRLAHGRHRTREAASRPHGMDEEETHEERGQPPKARHGYTIYKTLRPAQSSGYVPHGEARERPAMAAPACAARCTAAAARARRETQHAHVIDPARTCGGAYGEPMMHIYAAGAQRDQSVTRSDEGDAAMRSFSSVSCARAALARRAAPDPAGSTSLARRSEVLNDQRDRSDGAALAFELGACKQVRDSRESFIRTNDQKATTHPLAGQFVCLSPIRGTLK